MVTEKLLECSPYSMNGEKLSSKYTLTLTVLENSGNYLLHRDILRHHLSQHQGTSSTKTRSEVRGGGKKPWKQKGTGRARAGSKSSPLWKGGGVIFGPKPKNSHYKLNKKERRLAIQTLLYNKKNHLLLVDELEEKFNTSKTRTFLQFCRSFDIDLNQKLVIIVLKKTKHLKLATRNIENVNLISVLQLNTLDLIKSKQILLTISAMNTMKEVFGE